MSGEGGYLPIDEKKNKWSKKVIPTGSDIKCIRR